MSPSVPFPAFDITQSSSAIHSPHLYTARYNNRSSLEPYQLDRVPSHLSYNSKGV